MPIILGIRESIEHLQTDKVQVTQPVAIASWLTCNSMLCRIKHQPIAESFIFDMLNFQNNAFQMPVFNNNIRSDSLDKSSIYRRVYKSEIVDAIIPI